MKILAKTCRTCGKVFTYVAKQFIEEMRTSCSKECSRKFSKRKIENHDNVYKLEKRNKKSNTKYLWK